MKPYPPELDKNLQRVEKMSDQLGMPIDEDIKLLVAVLWSNDVPTSNSCGGHADRRNGGPFIEIESPDASKLERSLHMIHDDKKKSVLHEVTRIN